MKPPDQWERGYAETLRVPGSDKNARCRMNRFLVPVLPVPVAPGVERPTGVLGGLALLAAPGIIGAFWLWLAS